MYFMLLIIMIVSISALDWVYVARPRPLYINYSDLGNVAYELVDPKDIIARIINIAFYQSLISYIYTSDSNT